MDESNLGSNSSSASRLPPRCEPGSLRLQLSTHFFFKPTCRPCSRAFQSAYIIISTFIMGKELGPGVGFEFPSYEVKWLKRDLLLFANSIGATYPDELHFLYVSISSGIKTHPQSLYTQATNFVMHLTCPAGAPSLVCRLSDLSYHPPFQAHGPRSH